MRRHHATVALAASLSLVACHKSEPASSGSDAAPSSSSPAPPPSAPVDAVPLPAASVAKVVNPEGLPAYAGATGSVEGTIKVDGPPSPDAPSQDYSACPDAKSVYGKLFREGPAAADGSRPLADAVVAVTDYKDAFVPERNEAKTIAIRGCAFEQRTITMTFGQRLDVKNLTDQFWAPVLDQASTPALMIAAPRTVDPVKLYPPKPGWYTLSDHMKHGYAHADVFVLLQPLHAVSDLAGHYRIDGVPVGKVKVNARVGAIGTASAPVEILAGVVQKVDLVLHYAPKDAAAPEATPAKGADAGRPRELIK